MMNFTVPLQARRIRLDALLSQDRHDRRIHAASWLLAICTVGGIHAGLVWYLIHEPMQDPPSTPDMGTVMIDLAPEVQQAASQTDAAVAKPQEEAASVPEETPPPEGEEEPKPVAKVEEAPVSPVAALPPQPKERLNPKKIKPNKIAKPGEKMPPKNKPSHKPSRAAAVHTASAPRSDQKASATSAMSSGTSSSASAADWKSQVAAALNRSKRYPAGVTTTGSPTLRMSISASGQVSSVSVVTSSGSVEIDRAAIDTVYRASPLPAPPAGAMPLTFRMNFRP